MTCDEVRYNKIRRDKTGREERTLDKTGREERTLDKTGRKERTLD